MSRLATRMPMVKPAMTSIRRRDQDHEEHRRGGLRHDHELDQGGDEHQHGKAVVDEETRWTCRWPSGSR